MGSGSFPPGCNLALLLSPPWCAGALWWHQSAVLESRLCARWDLPSCESSVGTALVSCMCETPLYISQCLCCCIAVWGAHFCFVVHGNLQLLPEEWILSSSFCNYEVDYFWSVNLVAVLLHPPILFRLLLQFARIFLHSSLVLQYVTLSVLCRFNKQVLYSITQAITENTE